MSKKTENKTDKKQKQSKPEFAILSGDDVKKVQTIGRAIEKSEGSNRPQIVAILEANKKHHATIGAEIQKAARQAGLTNAPQTLKNWVYIWRKDNGLTAAKNEDNKGGQANKGKGQALKAVSDEVQGDWEDGAKTETGLVMGYAVMVETKSAENGEYIEGQEEECVLLNGEQAALAYSRILKEKRLALKAKREAKAKPLTDKEKADAKKAAKPAKATGNRNTKTKVTA